MGKAGKRKEMVEDRCVQVPCKSVVGERSVCKRVVCRSGVRVCERVVCVCVKVLWVKEWCGTGVGVKVLCVQDMSGNVCVCVKRIVCVCERVVWDRSVCKGVV